MRDQYTLLQTKGRSPNDTGNSIGCEWTIFKNGNPIKVFQEYVEAFMEYRKLDL